MIKDESVDEQFVEDVEVVACLLLEFDQERLLGDFDVFQAAVEEVELYFQVFAFVGFGFLFFHDGLEEGAFSEFTATGIL